MSIIENVTGRARAQSWVNANRLSTLTVRTLPTPPPTVGTGRKTMQERSRERAIEGCKLEAQAEKPEIQQAFLDAGIDEHFEPWFDMAEYLKEGAGRKKPQLAALLQKVNRVMERHQKLKRAHAGLDDLAANWESVPEGFRPDEVVDELRPYYLAKKALREESEESKEKSRARCREQDYNGLKSLGKIAVDVTGMGLEAFGQLDSNVLSQVKALQEGALVVAAGVISLRSLEEVLDKSYTNVMKLSSREDPNTNHANEILQQTATSGIEKAQQLIQLGKTLVGTASSLVSLGAHLPVVGAVSKFLGAITDALDILENILARMESMQHTARLKVTASMTDRGGGYDNSINAIRKGEVRNANESRDKAIGSGVSAVGKVVGGVGDVIPEPHTMAALKATGAAIQIGGVLVKVGTAIRYLIGDMKVDRKNVALLQQAGLGNPDAKIEVMRNSVYYAKMYVAIGAEEGDPVALAILQDLGFDPTVIEKSNKYVIRQAMMWGARQKDQAPGTSHVVVQGVKAGASAVAGAAGKVFHDAPVAAYEKVRNKNQSKDHRDAPGLYTAELTTQNWVTCKRIAYACGVRENSTGIEKALTSYEQVRALLDTESAGGLKQEHGPRVKATVASLDTVMGLFNSVQPGWVTPHPKGEPPSHFHKYLREMRGLASQAKADLLKRWEDGPGKDTADKEARYFVRLDAAAFAETCGFAKKNGVNVDGGAVKNSLEELAKASAAQKGDDYAAVKHTAEWCEALIRNLDRLRYDNPNLPGPDVGFSRYVAGMRERAAARLNDLRAEKERLYAACPKPAVDRLEAGGLAKAVSDLKSRGLKVEPHKKLVTVLKQAERFNDLAQGKAAPDPFTFYDQAGVCLAELRREAAVYKAACNFKPMRAYLINLRVKAGELLKAANAEKQNVLRAGPGGGNDGGDGGVPALKLGPVDMSANGWKRTKALAYVQGLNKQHKASGMQKVFKGLDSATKLPADEVKNPNQTRRAVQSQTKALKALIKAAQTYRGQCKFPPMEEYLDALSQKADERIKELETHLPKKKEEGEK